MYINEKGQIPFFQMVVFPQQPVPGEEPMAVVFYIYFDGSVERHIVPISSVFSAVQMVAEDGEIHEE